MSQPLLETIKIDVIPEGVGILTLNRPDRDNALNSVLLKDLLVAFQWATIEEKVKVVIITGNGKYFTSGWDLTEVSQIESLEEVFERMKTFTELIEVLIDFPKLLLAAVNAICAEACSSYLLPKFLGNSTANEMLVPSELVNHGFINRIIQKENLLNETIKEAITVTKFSFEAFKQTKQLIKSDDIRDHLKKVLKRENEALIER
ncbi:5981_t:CDS:2 [Diversispora eburnea]|uniref:5981_t:CDS:1 n=1 Tax=Diversispora eburnea TaxID=1213867 RepID=A0A9N9AAW9_9GLOM|nr:5981_t:CDS:2 [Diversispora eburnea]